MLDAFCYLLADLGNADDGVECVLSGQAKDSFVELVRTVYGEHAAEVVGNFFCKREDGSWTICEDAEEAFRLCLTGVG